jgi:polyphosphate glucokinase
MGKPKWRRHVAKVVKRLQVALSAEYVVLGGGNATLLKELPPSSVRGDNTLAFSGGFRLWEDTPKIGAVNDAFVSMP